jgi:spermidine synthase
MPNDKLEIRRSVGGVSFYIGGSLQFDTADEHIYHESLVLPAASILTERTNGPFEALIMGGGDGLALRELLRFPSLKHAVLVDYDPAVLKLGKTTFSKYNNKSLFDKRVKINVGDAADYLAASKKIYDLIIADFTFPDDLRGCGLFTSEFFSLIKKRLKEDAVLALNSVSPSVSSPAYWSIFRTLMELDLYPRPMRISIPSFMSHGYGDWGFLLASKRNIAYKELRAIKLPPGLKYLNKKRLLNNMKFSRAETDRGSVLGRTIREPSDLLCLLNLSEFWDPNAEGSVSEWKGRVANILYSFDLEAFLSEAEEKIK